jgi:hypothetical protein
MARRTLSVDIQKTKAIPFDWILRNESQELPLAGFISSRGTINPYGSLTTPSPSWRTATKPTIAADTWINPLNPIFQCDIGRRYVIKRIKISTTDDCEILIGKRAYKYTSPNVGGNAIILDRMIKLMLGSIKDTAGGEVVFDFTDGDYLTLRSGERLDFYYSRSGTTGTNYQLHIEGWSITNDDNYQAPFKIGVIGDSIGYATAAVGSLEYIEREDGTINGLWPFIIKNKLQKAGIESRLVNISQTGTDSSTWDFFANNGRLSPLNDANLLFVNLGMNDCNVDTGLSTVNGTDGTFKKYMKNVIRTYFRNNPSGSCIVNQITASDVSSKNANVASGIYAGTTRIVAYRTELGLVVSELKALNPSWDLHIAATDTAYTSAQTTYFGETESAGSYIHPNSVLGQPALAAIQWAKVQQTQFYLNNI